MCELDENRLLAETVLALLTRLIRDHVTCLEQKNAEVSNNSYGPLAFLDYSSSALLTFEPTRNLETSPDMNDL